VIDNAELRVADVVVDRLGNAGDHQLDPALVGERGDLGSRVHGIIPPDVEEPADVVGSDDLDNPLEVLLLPVGELVATGAHGACRGGAAEQADLLPPLAGHVDKLLQENSLDAVPCRVDRADLAGVGEAALDHALQRGVDDGRGSAGLGDESIPLHDGIYTR
jgi:hypothetical protein